LLRRIKMPRKVLRWRTIKPRKDVYIHVAVVPRKGPRGGRTVAEHIRYVGKKKVKKISRRRHVARKASGLRNLIGI
jgi:hypothetical protein